MVRQWLGILITAPLTAALVITANAVGLFQMLEWAALDRYFCLRPPEPIDPRIAIVTIDDADLEKIGKWPIPDAVLAKVLNNLKAHQPKAIGLDLYRNLPVPPGSEELTQVFKSTPNLIGIKKEVKDRVAPPEVLEQLGQIALADLVLDTDGKVRRALMSIKSENGKVNLSLGATLSLIYLESKRISLRQVDAEKKQLGLGKAIFTPLSKNDGGYVGADTGGYQLLLNYRGRQNRFHTLSITDVLDNNISDITDKIVLIGATGQSLNDLFIIPYDSQFFGHPQRTPGVVIHANVISQILSAALEGRPIIQVWDEPIEWVWIFFWSTIGAALPGVLSAKKRALVSVLFLGCGLLGGSYFMFLNGWWIPVVPPLVALIGSAVTNTSYILIEKIRLSHQQLEEYSRTLEAKVKERTLELEQKKEALEQQAIELEKAKETAIAASSAKSAFLANMSHELRTPLNAILGFTQLMARDPSLNRENQKYLEIINRSGEHLLSLINDVLDLSKIESGRIELYETNFDLHKLLDNLKQMLRLKAEEKGLNLLLQILPLVPQYIKNDEKKLSQVLINLLSNAIKFTEKGTIYLRVKLADYSLDKQTVTNQNNRLIFEVEDSGLGIAPQEMDLLFQSFVQTETGRKSGQGTGLGLPISRKFVQLMGGDITVSSKLGKGTKFTFDIRVDPAEITDIQASQVTQKVICLAPDQPIYRILVVDNVQENCQLLIKLLTDVGFEVDTASNGEEAIALWEKWQPHLIWMSMRMPIMDGYEATKRIKSTNQGKSTIVIALTASTFEDDQNLIFSIGCDGYVYKPFKEEEIFQTMAQHLGVGYIYENNDPTKIPSKFIRNTFVDNLQPSDFQDLPIEWVEQLYHAASECNDTLIAELIEEISQSHTSLATALSKLAYDYRFDIILNLTESRLVTNP